MPLSEKLTQVSTDCPPTILEDSPPIPQSSLPPIYEPRGVPFARVVDSTQSTTRDEVTDSVNTTSNSIEDAIMADTTTYIPTPSNNDNFGMGGGLLGGVVLTSLLGANRLGGVGGAGLGYEAGAINRNADVLQAMNQQQLASSTQIMTQDINHVGKDVALAAGATQSAIAAGNLQNTISTLQGQTALTSSIMDSTLTNAAGHTNILGQVASASADTNANINNARQGISGDIREALSVLDNDLHSISASIDRSIEGVRNDVTRSHLDMINAAHRGEISALKSANDIERSVYNTASVTQRAITDDGDKTRSLISNINVADLNRQIVVAENKLADARHDHRQSVASHDIIINNNNNATAVANALAQQQQQQQSNNLYAAVLGLTGHVNTLTQFTLNNGSGSATAIGGVAG